MKSRYYVVSSNAMNGIKKISKGKAYNVADIRTDIARILRY
ncbi:hypothetical protein DSAG12_04580 [Promethearchaeum syntrophicum]|uniref:Uncharacterized protein n=1 Tax=Promethearchaeum syntrophicum TaxID=2594042 RepID=A0AC61ZU52_9ARCH|nr:hypothetical protein [Candidatus Prometheoarchaeum syntrophicum]